MQGQKIDALAEGMDPGVKPGTILHADKMEARPGGLCRPSEMVFLTWKIRNGSQAGLGDARAVE